MTIVSRSHLLANVVFFVALCVPSMSFAQYILSSGFCLNVVRNECLDEVANGATVKISLLHPIQNTRRIYYWASVRTQDQAPVAVAMLRDGPCYQEEVTYSEDKFRNRPSLLTSIWAYVSSIGVGDILKALNVEKISGEAGLTGVNVVDAKLNVVIVPSSNGYRIYSYRFLSCAGTIRARILYNNGEPVPGDNDTKALVLAE